MEGNPKESHHCNRRHGDHLFKELGMPDQPLWTLLLSWWLHSPGSGEVRSISAYFSPYSIHSVLG